MCFLFVSVFHFLLLSVCFLYVSVFHFLFMFMCFLFACVFHFLLLSLCRSQSSPLRLPLSPTFFDISVTMQV
jgi:hypothetical protein